MDDIQLRIRKFIEGEGLTFSEFAKKIGTHQSSLSRALADGNKVGDATLNKISIAFGMNKRWLLTGEGSMLKEEKPFVNEVTSRPTSDYMMVEYADLRAAAGRIGGGDVSQLPETHRRLVPKEFNNGKFLVVRVDGDSMDDGSKRSLSDGDEVLIKEKTEDKWFDLPIKKTLFVITSREGNVLKQIKEINKDEKYILCHSFNPAYEDFEIFFEDIFQIFIVCKVVQRQISLI